MITWNKYRLFPITLSLFIILGVGPILLIAISFALPLQIGHYKIVLSFLLVLSTVSTLCLAGLVTRILKHPINQLLGGQRQIRHGNTEFRLTAQGNQELQLLFQGFNQMADSIEQAALQEQQQLAEQRAFTQFTSQIIHDLRSPLFSLKTASDCLSELKISDSHSKNVLNLIQLSSKRLEEVAEELLTKKRNLSSALKTPLHDVLDELILELHPTFPQLMIEREYFPSPIDLKILKRDLQRAISNILKNAVEAMKGQGKITIKTSLSDHDVVLQIGDTGPGMTSEILEKVLGGGFTYNKVNGNGIGMTVVREVVEKYKGELHARSQISEGTTFQLSFPMATPS